MDSRIIEVEIYRGKELQPIRIINAGPFPVDADDSFDCIECFRWPLTSLPETLEDLARYLFYPNVAGKVARQKSIEELFDTFYINRMVELDINERRAIIYKLMAPYNSDSPFSPPAYRLSKAEYYAVITYRYTFGCDHLETGIDFCPICNKEGDKHCLRCGAELSGEVCTKCNSYLGKYCYNCGGRHISLSCCCKRLEVSGVPAECSECCGSFQSNYLYVAKTCGCLTHWWCFIKDREVGKILCGKCGKQYVDDKEVVALQVYRFYLWIADNTASKHKQKVRFFSYKCNACDHISVDTLVWLCHKCSSPDVREYEPLYITHEEAEELLHNDFVCEVGGALQEFCSFICDHKIYCLYQGFLNGNVMEEDEEEEEEEEFFPTEELAE